jgi:hypothetical protein
MNMEGIYLFAGEEGRGAIQSVVMKDKWLEKR